MENVLVYNKVAHVKKRMGGGGSGNFGCTRVRDDRVLMGGGAFKVVFGIDMGGGTLRKHVISIESACHKTLGRTLPGTV